MAIHTKKVILVIIDALTSRVLEPAMDAGHLPNFNSLRNAGYYADNMSVFPSITHAALTSIVTGQYPQQHGILGCHWYMEEEEDVAFFAADPEIILNKDIADFAEGFIIRLNHEYLQAPTLFQIVERAGLHAASLNFLIFHGDVEHEVDMPFLLQLLPTMPSQVTIQGPTTLYLGDFVQHTPLALDDGRVRGGPENWFGFRDGTTADLLVQLARRQLFPDFTLAYFPHNDFLCHSQGPSKALEDLTKIDEHLGDLLAACGGLDAFRSEFCLIITGDHSQSEVIDHEEDASIDLDQILAGFQQADTGQSWDADDDIMICPNLRTAQIYLQTADRSTVQAVVDQLLTDSRVDQVFWSEKAGSDSRFHGVTSERGQLTFWRGQSNAQNGLDQFGNHWSWEGDLAVVDGNLVDGDLTFPDYPNAFERLAGVVDSANGGHVWATARPRHEFAVPDAEIHAGGGSHGSLHHLDSQTALFVVGAPDQVVLPPHPRIVDIAGIALSVLGLTPA